MAVSHGSTACLARAPGDSVLARVCETIATNEKRHETTYTRIVEQQLWLDPDGAVYDFFMPPAN
jgi:acyl-[acyl-carrier-protein] desaturase